MRTKTHNEETWKLAESNELETIMKTRKEYTIEKTNTDYAYKVAVTGAAGQIGGYIISMIANGDLLGDREVELRLLDIPEAENALLHTRPPDKLLDPGDRDNTDFCDDSSPPHRQTVSPVVFSPAVRTVGPDY